MDIKRNISTIVLDLDGTLLNSDHQVSERNHAVIKQAMAQNKTVIIATGKTRKSSEAILEQLQLTTPGVFVQGLILYDADGAIRQQHTLDSKLARQVIQYAEMQGFSVIAYCGNRIVTKRLDSRVEKIAEFGEPMPEAIGQLVNYLDQLKINKLIIFGDHRGKLNALRWQLQQQLDGKIHFTDGGVLMALEALPKGTSKGQGVKTILRQLDIRPENVMAIGDGENDIEMLELVGLGVAVENAAEKLKAVADEIVANHDEDGVAEAIERFVLKEDPQRDAVQADDTDKTETARQETHDTSESDET